MWIKFEFSRSICVLNSVDYLDFNTILDFSTTGWDSNEQTWIKFFESLIFHSGGWINGKPFRMEMFDSVDSDLSGRFCFEIGKGIKIQGSWYFESIKKGYKFRLDSNQFLPDFIKTFEG